MEITVLLFEEILSMLLMLLLGFSLVKAGFLASDDSRVLSVLLLYLVIPCVILNSFQVEYSEETVKGLLWAFAAAAAIHVVLIAGTWILGRIWRLSAIEKASVIYSNAGNLVVPIILAVLGEEWVIYSSAYITVQLFLLWTHGKSLVSGERGADWRRILTNVNLLAGMVGLVLFLLHIRLPDVLGETVQSVSQMVAPASLFIVGMLIAGMNWKKVFLNRRAWLVTGLRMVFFPLLLVLLLRPFVRHILLANAETVLLVTLFAAITPPASSITQMAQVYGKEAEYAGVINVLSTLVCVATMPLAVWIYQA